VAIGVKCGPCGGKNGKMKSWTVSWLSLKTKVELGLCGSRVISGEGYTEFAGFQWFTRKPLGSLVDPQIQDRRTKDGGARALDRSDRWRTPVRPVCDDIVRRLQSGGHALGSQGLH
jgi:hypothetical protein